MLTQLTVLMDKAQSDPALLASLRSATSAEDLVQIAADHGIALGDDDLANRNELSDAELELASGGTLLHPTMSVFCGTNGNFCTFNPYACQAPG